MATFTFAADFLEGIFESVHDLSSDTMQLAFSNTAPASESSNPLESGNGVLANVTQVSYTNYADNMTTDRVLENVTSNESSGTYTLDADDVAITATGGALAGWRYYYLFNQTATNDEIVGVWDRGSTLTLAEDESITLRFNASGIFTAVQV